LFNFGKTTTGKGRNHSVPPDITRPAISDKPSLDELAAAIESFLAQLAEHEQIGTSPKKVRGMAQRSLDLIAAMFDIAEAAQPITGRGVGYKLFVADLIESMSKNDMKRVYRLLKEAREQGIIPWEWIVDEDGDDEGVPSWDDPADFANCVGKQYRRDFWNQQPVRVVVWSEKGTVRGVLRPMLDQYGVRFRRVGGFASSGKAHSIAEDNDGRPLIIIYVGDYDPSGLYMSECDLPNRMKKYEGHHVEIRRIAVTPEQTISLPSFPASDKRKDTRYKWFTQNFGDRCWELDALDPNVLRDLVEREIKSLIEPDAWQRCELVNAAERDSLHQVLTNWGKPPPDWMEAFAEWGRREAGASSANGGGAAS
jgi:hypothetical protein